jgi:hypothetical protein
MSPETLSFSAIAAAVWCVVYVRGGVGCFRAQDRSSWTVSKLAGDEDEGYARRGKKMGRVQLAAILVPEDLKGLAWTALSTDESRRLTSRRPVQWIGKKVV